MASKNKHRRFRFVTDNWHTTKLFKDWELKAGQPTFDDFFDFIEKNLNDIKLQELIEQKQNFVYPEYISIIDSFVKQKQMKESFKLWK